MGEYDDDYYKLLMEILKNKELLKVRTKDDDLYEYFWAYWENNTWRDKDGNIVPLNQLQGETIDEDEDSESWEYESGSEEEDELDEVWVKISKYHKNIKDKCSEKDNDTGAKYYEFSLK